MLRMSDKSVFPLASANDLGSLIRATRRAHGWSQSDLGDRLNVHRLTIARLEVGGPVALPVALRALTALGLLLGVIMATGDPSAAPETQEGAR